MLHRLTYPVHAAGIKLYRAMPFLNELTVLLGTTQAGKLWANMFILSSVQRDSAALEGPWATGSNFVLMSVWAT